MNDFFLCLKNYFPIFDLFRELDIDQNKSIDLEEFKKLSPMLEKIYIKHGDEEDCFKKMDVDNSGDVSFYEFFDYLVQFMNKNNHVDLMETIQKGGDVRFLKMEALS